jgi:hypothetical protein
MNNAIRIIGFILLCANLYGQSPVNPHSRVFLNKAPMTFVSELPVAPPGTVGSYYLEESWKRTVLYLTDQGKLEDVETRLNLQNNSFEILYEQSVKVLSGAKVMSFEWTSADGKTEVFVSARTYKLDGVPMKGFLKLMEDGTYQLLMQVKTEVVPANYNVALDVGSKDNQITKVTRYYVSKNNTLVEVTSGKKKFTRAFKETFDEDISTLTSELNPKKTDDLSVLVSRLNKEMPAQQRTQ